MSKRPITFLVLLLSLCFAPLVYAQANYAIPRRINLDRIVRRTFPGFHHGPEEWNRLQTEGFYPIGWSRDGKLAYYLEPFDEACGCYFAELIILDLRNDKILYHFKNDPESRVDVEGSPIEDDIRKLWRRNQKLFSEKLREHRIVPSASFPILGRTFRSGRRSYSAKMTVKKIYDDGFGLNRVRTATLELSSPGLGKKTIFTVDHSNEPISPLDSAIAGVFKSPFENRAAVIMINVQRGWEGPPHIVEVKIAGADLVTGFRK